MNQTLRALYKEFEEFRRNQQNWDKQTEEKKLRLFRKFNSNLVLDLNVSITEIFENLSAKGLDLIHFEFTGLNEDNEENVELKIPKFFHSIVPFSDPPKCFTLFSEFNSTYRNRKFKLTKLKMVFMRNNQDFLLQLMIFICHYIHQKCYRIIK